MQHDQRRGRRERRTPHSRCGLQPHHEVGERAVDDHRGHRVAGGEGGAGGEGDRVAEDAEVPVDGEGPRAVEERLQLGAQQPAAEQGDPEQQHGEAVAGEPEDEAADAQHQPGGRAGAEGRADQGHRGQPGRGVRVRPAHHRLVERLGDAAHHPAREQREEARGERGQPEADEQEDADRGVEAAHVPRHPAHQPVDGVQHRAQGPGARAAAALGGGVGGAHADRGTQDRFRGGRRSWVAGFPTSAADLPVGRRRV